MPGRARTLCTGPCRPPNEIRWRDGDDIATPSSGAAAGASPSSAATTLWRRRRPAGPHAGRAVPRGRLLHDEVVVDLADPVDLGGAAPGPVLGGLRVHDEDRKSAG